MNNLPMPGQLKIAEKKSGLGTTDATELEQIKLDL